MTTPATAVSATVSSAMNSWAAAAGPARSRSAPAAAAGDQPQQGIDDERQQDRELQVVVPHRGDAQRGGEAEDGPGQGRRDQAGAPPAGHPEHGGGRAREPQRQYEGEGGLGADGQGQRGEHHAGQQERCVPHQVDTLRRVQCRGDQVREPSVGNRRGLIPHEPGEQVDVVQTRHGPARPGPGWPGRPTGARSGSPRPAGNRPGSARSPPGCRRGRSRRHGLVACTGRLQWAGRPPDQAHPDLPARVARAGRAQRAPALSRAPARADAPRRWARLEVTRMRVSSHTAATPSFQVIFLPSSRLRAR